jgi:hypothetical protein
MELPKRNEDDERYCAAAEKQWAAAEKAIDHTAAKIAKEVDNLFLKISLLNLVDRDYVIAELFDTLIYNNSKLVDWLNGVGRGNVSMRLAQAPSR